MFSSPSIMFGLGLQELLTYGFSGLVVVVCLGVIARAVFVPSDVRRVCCCGGCGHAIVDTASNRCPECGGQLTKVGISTPSMAVRLRGGLGWALLAWTVACGVMAQAGWGYVQQAAWAAAMTAPAMPTKMQHTRDTTFSPFLFGGGPSRSQSSQADMPLEFRIECSLSYVEDAGTIDSGTAGLTLRKSGTQSRAVLDLDLAARAFTLKNQDDKVVRQGKAEELDRELIDQWFTAAGVAIAGEAAENSLADSLKLVKGCMDDPSGFDSSFGFGQTSRGSLQSSGGGSSSGPVGGGAGGWGGGPPAYWTTRTQVISAVLGTIYVAGCIGIWWRHRRLLR